MAQGQVLKSKKKVTPSTKKKAVTRGARHIAPKKTILVKQEKLRKKMTAQINKNVEQQMATKAGAVGKLTIMKNLVQSDSKAGRGKRSSGKK
ncbi:MAG: hypothetical protein DHS80DRAFT_33824 [Piptocephalis tieghemiana]|nr:MAG: hypothetical protein DHS80DRAFT_33824 [Piptocephalis tieghemiana]